MSSLIITKQLLPNQIHQSKVLSLYIAKQRKGMKECSHKRRRRLEKPSNKNKSEKQ